MEPLSNPEQRIQVIRRFGSGHRKLLKSKGLSDLLGLRTVIDCVLKLDLSKKYCKIQQLYDYVMVLFAFSVAFSVFYIRIYRFKLHAIDFRTDGHNGCKSALSLPE